MDGRYPIDRRCSDAELLFGNVRYDQLRCPSGILAAVMFAAGVLLGLLVF